MKGTSPWKASLEHGLWYVKENDSFSIWMSGKRHWPSFSRDLDARLYARNQRTCSFLHYRIHSSNYVLRSRAPSSLLSREVGVISLDIVTKMNEIMNKQESLNGKDSSV